MSPEEKNSLISILETGIARLKEADNIVAEAKVLKIIGSICTHKAEILVRDFQLQVDERLFGESK